MTTSKIEWTDETWNPVRGCSRVSEGCRNCYAERMAARFSGRGGAFRYFADQYQPGSKWTGRVELIPSKLGEPLRWRKPRRVFVNSMSDLYHESLSDESIFRIYQVMAAASRHTFQVLTKRPRRAREFHESTTLLAHGLPNVWLGVSVEDQETADERISLLLQTPAALRFVSYEPALGPVDFHWRCAVDPPCEEHRKATLLDWVIVGGESGPHARRFDIEWARSVIRQCREAGVPCFVKQLGARPYSRPDIHSGEWLNLASAKGGDPSEWPEDLRVRETPGQ